MRAEEYSQLRTKREMEEQNRRKMEEDAREIAEMKRKMGVRFARLFALLITIMTCIHGIMFSSVPDSAFIILFVQIVCLLFIGSLQLSIVAHLIEYSTDSYINFVWLLFSIAMFIFTIGFISIITIFMMKNLSMQIMIMINKEDVVGTVVVAYHSGVLVRSIKCKSCSKEK